MTGDDEASSAEAFEFLRMEVALLRRAVEGLAAETTAPTDYSPTLAKLLENINACGRIVQAIAQSPALAASVRGQNAQLQEVRQLAAQQAKHEWKAAIEQVEAQSRTLGQIIGSAHDQDTQLKWLIGVGCGGCVAGILACAVGLRLLA